jgi:hypothetical protein
MIIGICGHKGVGKSTVCEVAINLERPVKPFIRHGFADPLYKMLHAMGISEEIVYNKERWDEPLDILCGKSTRYACQTLGTEWGRAYFGSIWTNAAMNRAEKAIRAGQIVILDNVRMIDEVKAIRDRGGVLIAFTRLNFNTPTDTHDSEEHIAQIQRECDIGFTNSGSDLETDARNFRKLLDSIC